MSTREQYKTACHVMRWIKWKVNTHDDMRWVAKITDAYAKKKLKNVSLNVLNKARISHFDKENS